MDLKEAVKEAHEMYAYEVSEQSDKDNQDFDALWQSIFDVCQLATYGIIDDLVEEEISEAIEWLKITQSMTKLYKNKEINF